LKESKISTYELPEKTVLLHGLTVEEADTVGLVLASQRIPYKFVRTDDQAIDILVDIRNETKANHVLLLYSEENQLQESIEPSLDKFNKSASGLFIATLLLLVHLKTSSSDAYHAEIVQRFGSSAERIVDGSWHLSVTALFLHGDTLHLAGNMAGIVLFCSAVVSICGLGTGWLMVLLSGTAGNLANAFFYQTEHISIGASTAVFGAVGILSTIRATRLFREKAPRIKALLPVGAGLALLGLLGSSEQTDVLAHFFGFCAGGVLGAIDVLLFRNAASNNDLQWILLVLAVFIVAISWLMPGL